jgi:hypothetical protein
MIGVGEAVELLAVKDVACAIRADDGAARE